MGKQPTDLQVVGVAANVSELGVGADPTPTFYLPAGLGRRATMSVLVRTTGEPLASVAMVRSALRDVSPDIPMSQVATMNSLLSDTLIQPRFRVTMVVIFGLVSLTLSAIGLYGLLAYFVRQRSCEIGIRLALGAGRGRVCQLVLVRGMGLVGLGSAIGAVAAVAAARAISSQNWLFEVGPADPLTLAGVIMCLGLVALVACLGPAYRAGRMNPADVMRAE